MRKTVFSLIGKKRRKRLLFLLPAMLLGSLLEMLGMGLIVSVCALLVNDEWYLDSPLALRVCALLHIQPGVELVAVILFSLVALYIFKFFYLAWENYMVFRFVRTSRSEIVRRLFRNIIHAPYPFFVSHSSSDIHNLLGRDVNEMISGLNACMQLILEGLVALGMGLFLLLVDPMMTIFASAGILVLLLLTRLVLNRFIKRATDRQRTASKTRWKWLHQAIVGIKDIRIGGHEDFFDDRFSEMEQVFCRTDSLKQFWIKLPALCIETVMVLSVLLYLLFLISEGRELVHYLPSLSALALVAVRLLPSCNRINSSLTQIAYAKASVYALCDALQMTEPAARDEARPQRTVRFEKGISLRGVTYAYEGGTGEVLKDVDMDIPAGASVGIVGSSGAGKTTLLDVLLGLLPPAEGQVLVDGVPIAECYKSYLQKVAYMPQDIFLLDDTVRNNVAMGEEEGQIDDERVWEALRQATLAQTVSAFPAGLDTQIGEHGIRLSGGERQRLGLARIMYRDPSVIVFDEATSALDMDTEAAVLRSIAKLKNVKTLVIVSHRQSAVESCDRIYRVKDKTVLREK